MSEYNQTVERNQEEGSIGIGAMIVFIALILGAAVASTIIIKTAEELQQNAESTSDDTRKEISGKVNIIQIIVNGSTNDDIDSMIVTAKIASGSTDVQVRDIEWAIVCGGTNGFGLITGNLGTENWYGGSLDATNPSPNADRLNGADYAAGDELAAGTTFKFEIDLGPTDVADTAGTGAADDKLDNGDFSTSTTPGCDAEAGAGQELELRVVVDGGGETLANLKIESITLGKSIM